MENSFIAKMNETIKEIVQKGKEVLERAGLLQRQRFVEVGKVKAKKGIKLFY